MYQKRSNQANAIRHIEEVVQDGVCTSCGTCAAVCPKSAIQMHMNNKLGIFQAVVNSNKCISCGLCVEACPYDALYMGYAYERAQFRRGNLVQTNEEMLESEKRRRSAYMHPELREELPRQTLLLDRITEED